jgi:hypothetical protein
MEFTLKPQCINFYNLNDGSKIFDHLKENDNLAGQLNVPGMKADQVGGATEQSPLPSVP